MHRIKIICFGKLKEAHWRAACAEYEKRLQPVCKLEIIELAPAYLPENPSQAQIGQALAQEAQLAQGKIPKGAIIAALCVEGKCLRSEKFAAWLESQSETVLLIGSSFGLDENLKKQAQLKLSLSDMTFPHQLARVMLLEQIYRASKIQSGGKYHK